MIGRCPIHPIGAGRNTAEYITAPYNDADLNAQIASSVLASLQPGLFDATGLLRSAWLTRMTSLTDDAQGMLDELLV